MFCKRDDVQSVQIVLSRIDVVWTKTSWRKLAIRGVCAVIVFSVFRFVFRLPIARYKMSQYSYRKLHSSIWPLPILLKDVFNKISLRPLLYIFLPRDSVSQSCTKVSRCFCRPNRVSDILRCVGPSLKLFALFAVAVSELVQPLRCVSHCAF